MHPLAAKRQQWRGPAGRRPAQGVIAQVQQWTEREAKVCTGNRNRRTRVPEGNHRTVRSCEPYVTMRLPRRPLKRLPGRVTPPPVAEYGTRVPSH